MNRSENFFRPLMWLMTLMLAVFVAGCGGGGGGGGGPPAGNGSTGAAGAVCSGANCIDLATAGTYTVLGTAAINDTGPSAITGNIGTSGNGANIAVSCAEMTGTIIDADAAYAGGSVAGATACRQTDSVGVGQAVTDAIAAYLAAGNKTPDTFPGIAVMSGTTPFGPGVYSYTAGVAITTDITLQGTASDVWVFQVTGNLSQSTNTTVTLAGGALAQNVFWRVTGASSLAAGSHFEGIVLTPNAISAAAGSSVNGRLITGGGGAVNLNTNTVRRPGA